MNHSQGKITKINLPELNFKPVGRRIKDNKGNVLALLSKSKKSQIGIEPNTPNL